MPPRIVMHVDMDAFYASVEVRYRPELRGRPVIVGGFPAGRRAVGDVRGPRARRTVRMPSPQARRLAPRATFVDPNFELHGGLQGHPGVFGSVTAVVESASIDEAFLDLTGSVSMFGPRHRSGSTSGRWWPTSSRSPARWDRPDEVRGQGGLPRGEAGRAARGGTGRDRGLPAPHAGGGDVGVGLPTAEKLHRLGVQTVGDLATRRVARCAGPSARMRGGAGRAGVGRDRRRVSPRCPSAASVRSRPSADSDDPDVVRRELLRMADRTASRMRKQRVVGRTVSISVRFADFTELTRSTTVPAPTDVTEEIYEPALGSTTG